MAAIRIDNPMFEASALPTSRSRRNHRDDAKSSATTTTTKRATTSKASQSSFVATGRLMSERTAQWATFKTPATSVGDALARVKLELVGEGGAAAASLWERLERGIVVHKVTTRGQLKKRIVTVSEDGFALFVTHAPIKGKKNFNMAKTLNLPLMTRKGIRGLTTSTQAMRGEYVRYIDVADIDGLQLGFVGTAKLELARMASMSMTKNRLKGYRSEKIDGTAAQQIVTLWHHGNESLDLLVPNAHDRQALECCVRRLKETYQAATKHVSNEDLLLRYIWYDVDVNQDGLISKREFSNILSRINFHVKNAERKFQNYAKELGGRAADGLTYPQVMNLLQRLKTGGREKRSVAQDIWDETFGKGQTMVTVEDFLKKFLHKVQGMKYLTLPDAKEIVIALNYMEINHQGAHAGKNFKANKHLTLARFETFLFDPMNDAYDPWALRPGGSLDHPMSQYWINSSHNTYLTGDQLQSTSSVSMYMMALRRGCKCLELDVWDGETSSSGEPLPVVYHGHTLTSKILFADILQGVKAYMISNPDTYPVILSLENHCSNPFQLAMAGSLIEILGDFLHIPSESDRVNYLPSPEKLKGMVVIKGKRPPEPDEDGKTESLVADGMGGNGRATTPKKTKTVPELARLTLFHGVKFKAFEKSLDEPPTHMHSIGETKIPKLLNKDSANTTLWRQYNTQHMTRTYPAGSRVDSSNYNPVAAWAVGCQLVALNFQTSDAPLILNDGRFRADRQCGYILKPKSLMDKEVERDENEDIMAMPSLEDPQPTAREEKNAFDFMMGDFEGLLCGQRTPSLANHELLAQQPRVEKALVVHRIRTYQRNTTKHVEEMRLRIRVLAGSCLPKPHGSKSGEYIDPYVCVTLHDVKERGSGKATYLSASYKTNMVLDNGFCPVWDNQVMKEFIVVNPEVAMLQFTVMEQDVVSDDRIAEAAIPCHRLRTGYRSVQLYDKHNTRTGPFAYASLLVQLQVV